MRAVVLLGLAGCWSSSPPKPVETTPVETKREAKPVRKKQVVIEDAKPVVEAPPPTPPPKRPPHVLSSKLKQALASEAIAGNVLVPHGVAMHATAAAARGDAKAPTNGDTMAMRVIKDHGDVVELATARVADCSDNFKKPYELTVFVKRDKLTLRTKVDVVTSYKDGTAIAVDRGAPISLVTGLQWRNLGALPLSPTEDQLTYAVPAKLPPATLPQITGEPLVCDQGGPMTMAEWRKAKEQEREREARARADERRAESERRRAELQHQCEARKAAEAKKPKPKKKNRSDAQKLADMLVSMDSCDVGGGMDLYSDGGMGGWDLMGRDERYAPFCGVGDPAHYYSYGAYGSPAPKTPPPTINGTSVSWPDYDTRTNNRVIKQSTYYLADVGYECGRVRMAVERDGVRKTGGGAGIGGGGQVQVWVPKQGPVWWPDGSPAGKYTGTTKYQHVVEQADRICVRVQNIAELVCHDKKTTKTEMSSHRFGLGD